MSGDRPIRCCCSRCQGKVTFASVDDYQAHVRQEDVDLQLSLFPDIRPDAPFPA